MSAKRKLELTSFPPTKKQRLEPITSASLLGFNDVAKNIAKFLDYNTLQNFSRVCKATSKLGPKRYVISDKIKPKNPEANKKPENENYLLEITLQDLCSSAFTMNHTDLLANAKNMRVYGLKNDDATNTHNPLVFMQPLCPQVQVLELVNMLPAMHFSSYYLRHLKIFRVHVNSGGSDRQYDIATIYVEKSLEEVTVYSKIGGQVSIKYFPEDRIQCIYPTIGNLDGNCDFKKTLE